MSLTMSRERRSWTAKEDQLLRDAVQKEDPDNANPSKWHAIAKHVPNRTNKDCRKRWFAKMASDVVKGGWSPEEDERLVKGIERYGTRWSLVASVVQTRNSDQCAKRWTDTLNPAIDRTTWTSEADELLLRAVAEHGKVWTKIVKTYFPGRTGLSAKNRYNSITRFNSDSSRASRPRRKSSEVLHHHPMARKSGSVSSSSSVSPSSTSISLPYTSSSFQHPLDIKPQHYHLEQYANSWSSSSSVTTDEISSYRSSPMAFDYSPDTTTPSTPSPNSDYQSYDLPMNHQVSPYSESTQLYQESVPPVPHSNQVYKPFHSHGHTGSPFQGHQFSHFPAVQVHSGNESSDQFGVFDGQTTSVDGTSAITGLSWDAMSSTQDVKPLSGGFRAPLSNNTYSYVF